jgi:hypothetical protein
VQPIFRWRHFLSAESLSALVTFKVNSGHYFTSDCAGENVLRLAAVQRGTGTGMDADAIA